MNIITLISSDDIKMTIDLNIALKSQTIKNLLLDIKDQSEIKISNINHKVLSKIFQYYKKYPTQYDSPNQQFNYIFDEWDTYYFNIPYQEILELMVALNYLDIKDLLDLSCKYIASLINGKNVSEIRSFLGITNDFTPEEEKQIKEQDQFTP